MAKSETELMKQFEELLTDMRELNHGLLKSKNPQNTSYVDTRLLHLSQIVRRNPEQAEAVLWCADAMWHLLYEAAWSGVGSKQGRNELPHGVADADTINKALDQAYRDNPTVKNITDLRDKVCTELGVGRSTLLEKTKYNPLKK